MPKRGDGVAHKNNRALYNCDYLWDPVDSPRSNVQLPDRSCSPLLSSEEQYLCSLLFTGSLKFSHRSTRFAMSFRSLFFSASGVFAF